MRDGADRRPGAVPDGEDGGPVFDRTRFDTGGGADTDGDGHPDTLLTPDGVDLLVLTDLDGDGLADRVLRIGPDGAVHAGTGHGEVGHAATGYEDVSPVLPHPGSGSAPARTSWGALFDRLLGSDP